jgi:hypothetical protein
MAFVVEDGSGREDARSYASVDTFKDFAEFRVGVTVPADETVIQKGLVTASEWIDSNFANSFKGGRSFPKQNMEFPRTGFVDSTGYAIPNAMPNALIKAVCILAIEAMAGKPLYNNNDPSQKQSIVEDSIGPLVTKYSPQSPGSLVQERQFPEVQATLRPLLKGFGMLRVDR